MDQNLLQGELKIIKQEEDYSKLEEIEEACKVLSNEIRLKTLCLIYHNPGLSEKEVQNILDLSQGNLAYHIKRLSQVNLIDKNQSISKRKLSLKINHQKFNDMGVDLSKFCNGLNIEEHK